MTEYTYHKDGAVCTARKSDYKSMPCEWHGDEELIELLQSEGLPPSADKARALGCTPSPAPYLRVGKCYYWVTGEELRYCSPNNMFKVEHGVLINADLSRYEDRAEMEEAMGLLG